MIEALRNGFFSAFLFRLEEVSRGIEDPHEALRVGLTAYIAMALEKPHHYRAAFTLDTIQKESATGADGESFEDKPNLRVFRLLLDRLNEVTGALDETPTELETMARSLWASVHGLVLLMINFPHWPRTDRDRQITAHVNQILNGIYPR